MSVDDQIIKNQMEKIDGWSRDGSTKSIYMNKLGFTVEGACYIPTALRVFQWNTVGMICRKSDKDCNYELINTQNSTWTEFLGFL